GQKTPPGAYAGIRRKGQKTPSGLMQESADLRLGQVDALPVKSIGIRAPIHRDSPGRDSVLALGHVRLDQQGIALLGQLPAWKGPFVLHERDQRVVEEAAPQGGASAIDEQSFARGSRVM